MKRLFAIEAALAVILLFLVAVQGSRFIESHSGARLALARAARTGLKPGTIEYLRSLRGHVAMAYFVSARQSMPSSMKGIEDAVRAVLERFKEAAPERIDIRVLDPGLDQGRGASYASGKGASPIKVRKVLQDESSEEAVWSSLAVSHDRDPDVLLQGIVPSDVPFLEDWLVESLKAAEKPITPTVAVAAPGRGYAAVRGLVEGRDGRRQPCRVVSADLDGGAGIPLDADLLLWIEPGRLTPEHARELERFLATGRSAIVAGSAYSIEYLARPDGKQGYRAVTSPCDWRALLRPFGLDLAPLLLLDKNHEAIAWRAAAGAAAPVDAAFQLRILPSLFDTKGLLGPNAGALVVSAVSPIQIDPEAAASSGRDAQVIATTSEHARALDLPGAEFDDAVLEGARPVPKQPWMVLLKPRDAWKGDLIVAGSPILFHDDVYAQRGNANRVFLETLLRTYTHPSRLARIRVPRPAPEPIPAMTTGSRLAWRGAAVLLVPAALMALALRPGRARGLRGPRAPWTAPAAGGAVALAVILLALRACGGPGAPAADVTEDKVHTPSPLTSRIVEGLSDGLEATLFASDGLHMPARLKRLEPRIVSTLRRLGIRPRIVRPEDLPAAEGAALRASGIAPFEVEIIEDDSTSTARIWCALRLERAGRTEVIPQIDARAVEHLEFLLASAAKRLAGDRARLVGVLSDLPRLSPAEAHSDYQQKGYTAPVGSDVYSFAKRLLAQHGYRVAYINPDAPVFPEGMDLLVWLQPRNPVKAYPLFTRYLASGGKAIVALQHYNVQQRQYRGTGFETVYWPQPQFHGFNDYLRLIGARQVGDKQGEQPGEVLFDRNHADLVLETQVNRSAFREHDAQQVSRPFLIRASGEGLSAASVITSRLGDLLFIWPGRFALEAEKLAGLGIRGTVLVTTSERTWNYAWSGGWIPEASFAEPAAPSLGRQPLAVLLEGSFPNVEPRKEEGGRETLVMLDSPAPGAAPGKLLLIGCSEMFKNHRLFLPEYHHDQLLLNAVAFLAHGEELAQLAARRAAPRTFPFQPAGTKLRWRLIAVALAPLLFAACGLLLRWRRSRPLLGGGRRP
jgi:hypothetical protein